MLNIVESIRARAVPGDLALVHGGREVSYGDLFTQVDALAAQLCLHFPGEDKLRIGVQFPTGLDYVPIALAVLAAGLCFVPIPDELAVTEKTELLERTALDGVIVVEASPLWLPSNAETLGHIKVNDITAAVLRLPPRAPAFPLDAFAALNPAFIRFSSGTTGKSKGVVLSHESLLARIRSANEGLKIGPQDRVLWVLPMAHHFAVSIILYLYHGATTIIEDKHLGEDLLRAVHEQQVTVMYGSPVHYRQLASAPGNLDWPALRLAVATAAALDAATAQQFRVRFGHPLVQGLGIIEVGLPLLNIEGAAVHPESIGKPQPGYECLIRDAYEGVGELCLRGPGMFDAYLDPWQPRAVITDSDGWFATGDMAKIDNEGRVFLCGRSKSLINVGGMKVFPEEVEQVLNGHPKVVRSLVEARLHPLFGEVPVARYIPGTAPPTVAELRTHCREHLASYKMPLIFSAATTLPTTASGKLLRRGQD
ncbi:MAG: AMP-dependent synthetase and ligase [Verrucomicrobiaceae bacterium]|nr:AMP-dependent synthetase and ligase [Verrucomicrobiaceae bacterium]